MKIKDFKRQRKDCIEKRMRLEKQMGQISALRLIVFFAAAVGIATGFVNNTNLYILLGMLGLIVFLILVRKHDQCKTQILYEMNREAVLQAYIDRFSDKWQDFSETGDRWLSDEYPCRGDLDLFGKASLYQYLCSAGTPIGKRRLAELLCAKMSNPEEIQERQKAVAELIEHQELSFHLQTLGRMFSNEKREATDDSDTLINEVESSKWSVPSWIVVAAWLLPIATIVATAFYILGHLPLFVPLALIFSQILFAMLGRGKIGFITFPLLTFYDEIRAYEKLIISLEQASFQNPLLKRFQMQLTKGGKASDAIKKLRRIGDRVNVQNNVLVYALAFSFFMWDYHTLISFQSWKNSYGSQLQGWLNAVGETEALLSLAVLGQVKAQTCFPKILTSDSPIIEAKKICHPLLSEDHAVSNSISLRAQTCIITGSNMSGKTTFLRCIGTNLILAYAGAPICGEALSASVMAIFTSMRIQDDISRGISTFYGELLRIKSMVTYGRSNKPMLALIDEIFKGTNSADRIIGAREAVKKLTGPWSITLVSTHDFELCDLVEAPDIHGLNYHFEEHYESDEIHFDYTLKKGKCQTTNAQHLLKMAGIIDELPSSATLS